MALRWDGEAFSENVHCSVYKSLFREVESELEGLLDESPSVQSVHVGSAEG